MTNISCSKRNCWVCMRVKRLASRSKKKSDGKHVKLINLRSMRVPNFSYAGHIFSRWKKLAQKLKLDKLTDESINKRLSLWRRWWHWWEDCYHHHRMSLLKIFLELYSIVNVWEAGLKIGQKVVRNAMIAKNEEFFQWSLFKKIRLPRENGKGETCHLRKGGFLFKT